MQQRSFRHFLNRVKSNYHWKKVLGNFDAVPFYEEGMCPTESLENHTHLEL